MRLDFRWAIVAGTLLVSACGSKGNNPVDPYEAINRKTHAFNRAFDATFLKPPAKLYKAIVPSPLQTGISNFFNNLDAIPSIGNDLLQADFRHMISDTSRFCINSTLGIFGLLDVATRFNLPAHSNDLGLTFAKWGNVHSPYLVIPFLGPSTYRDATGLAFQAAIFTLYPSVRDDIDLYTLIYAPELYAIEASLDTIAPSLLGLHYINQRSQLLETDRLLSESVDHYTFVRDAYLQHRHFLISGEQTDTSSLYVDDEQQASAPS